MPEADEATPEVLLAEDIAGFTHDPLGYALYAYPWGDGQLADVQVVHQNMRIVQKVGVTKIVCVDAEARHKQRGGMKPE